MYKSYGKEEYNAIIPGMVTCVQSSNYLYNGDIYETIKPFNPMRSFPLNQQITPSPGGSKA